MEAADFGAFGVAVAAALRLHADSNARDNETAEESREQADCGARTKKVKSSTGKRAGRKRATAHDQTSAVFYKPVIRVKGFGNFLTK